MARKVKTAAQLRTENAELQERLDQAEAAQKRAEAKAEHMQRVATKESPDPVMVADDGDAPADYDEPHVLFDPFSAQNPHRIIDHPEGWRLSWINHDYRERHRGWRGWIPIEADDPIGQNLHRYLLDPPRRMEKQIDKLIRRGDLVLARLPIDMWNYRRQQSQDKAQRLFKGASADMTVDVVKNGKTVTPMPQSGEGKHYAGRTMTSD